MRRMRSRTTTVMVVAVLVCLAACSAESRDEPGPAAGDGVLTTEVGADDQVEPPPPPPSPLTEFLVRAGAVDESMLGGDEGAASVRHAAFDQVRVCMAAEGFDWLAPSDASFDQPDAEWTPEAVRQYGFGVSTRFFDATQVGPDLIGREPADPTDTSTADPNADYEASLSPEEATAYFWALHGEVPGDPDPPGSTAPDCLDRYWYEYVRKNDDVVQNFSSYFEEQLAEISSQVATDTRMVALETEIRDCVNAAGFDEFIDLESVIGQLEAALRPLAEAVAARDPYASLSEGEAEQLSDDEYSAMMQADRPPLTDTERDDLADLQARELALGGAVVDCGGVTRLTSLRRELEAEYELAFVAENQGALLAFLDELRSS